MKIRTILPSIITAKLLFTFLRRLAANNVVSYPISIGYTMTRKEYIAVALCNAVIVH